MNFGQAIEALKEGRLVAREGWNGKGMFIFMRPADAIPVGIVIENVQSLPKAVKEYFRSHTNGETRYASGEEIKVKFTQYLCMKASDGTVVNGWLASQTDMLSEDWTIVE